LQVAGVRGKSGSGNGQKQTQNQQSHQQLFLVFKLDKPHAAAVPRTAQRVLRNNGK